MINIEDRSAAIMIPFGSVHGVDEFHPGVPVPAHAKPSRFFPGYIVFFWRDNKGFNPGVAFFVTQFGRRDPHTMPHGIRVFYNHYALFGYRWPEPEEYFA